MTEGFFEKRVPIIDTGDPDAIVRANNWIEEVSGFIVGSIPEGGSVILDDLWRSNVGYLPSDRVPVDTTVPFGPDCLTRLEFARGLLRAREKGQIKVHLFNTPPIVTRLPDAE